MYLLPRLTGVPSQTQLPQYPLLNMQQQLDTGLDALPAPGPPIQSKQWKALRDSTNDRRKKNRDKEVRDYTVKDLVQGLVRDENCRSMRRFCCARQSDYLSSSLQQLMNLNQALITVM